ncbi:hypothetical protein JL720_7899 [Aureococcus anophagefferens]|nr:hypothetical protein JL720_7899 [Aureococcus anophagefferens]
MEKLPISLVLSCGDVVIRMRRTATKLGAVAKAFAKSYEAKHKARVGDVFEDGDNVTVSVGDDKPSPRRERLRAASGEGAAAEGAAAAAAEEAYNDALRMKDQANERFSVRACPRAGALPKALDTLGPPATDDEKQLGATLLNNRAACHLKQDRFADAQGDCGALALRPSSKACAARPRLKKDPANLRGYRVDVVAALDAAGADAPAVRRDVVAAAAVAEGFAALALPRVGASAAAPGAPYGGVFLLGSALDDDALALAVAFGALEAPPFLFAHGADDRAALPRPAPRPRPGSRRGSAPP